MSRSKWFAVVSLLALLGCSPKEPEFEDVSFALQEYIRSQGCLIPVGAQPYDLQKTNEGSYEGETSLSINLPPGCKWEDRTRLHAKEDATLVFLHGQLRQQVVLFNVEGKFSLTQVKDNISVTDIKVSRAETFEEYIARQREELIPSSQNPAQAR